MQAHRTKSLDAARSTGGQPDRDTLHDIEWRARRMRAEAWGTTGSVVRRWLRDRVIEPLRRAWRRRVDLETLMALDDRTLDDIGLQRSQIKPLVYGGARLNHSDERAARPVAADIHRLPTRRADRPNPPEQVPEAA